MMTLTFFLAMSRYRPRPSFTKGTDMFKNVIALFCALLSLLSVSNAQTIADNLPPTEQAIEYQFTVSIAGEEPKNGSATLAIGVPATLTYFDENRVERYKFILLGRLEKVDAGLSTGGLPSKGKFVAHIVHSIHTKVGNTWVELASADFGMHLGTKASVNLFNDARKTAVSIEGVTNLLTVTSDQVEQASKMDCGSSPAAPSIKKDEAKTGAEDKAKAGGNCCGGQCCNNSHSYTCCASISCCICGCCCVWR